MKTFVDERYFLTKDICNEICYPQKNCQENDRHWKHHNKFSSELQLVMKSELEQMEENDGFSKWRQQEILELASEVQSAIVRSQNPLDCSSAKKLVCQIRSQGCGFGCLIHQTVYCLITAVATRRVLILGDQPWWYSNITIKHFFLPLSNTCTSYEGTTGSFCSMF